MDSFWENIEDTMDINTKIGSKVKFSFPENGTLSDIEEAKKYLTINKVYTIKEIIVGSWHTTVVLEEFPTVNFNSVQFKNVKGEN